MGLLDFLAPAEPAPTTWRRLRYGSADKASQALSLLGEAGFPLEIRCRVDETARVHQLVVGGAEPAFRALDAMAADHELLLDSVDRPPRALPGNWVPGSLAFDRPELDVRVAANGMFVRQTGTRDQRRQSGAPVRLPAPAVGFAIRATLPFVEEPPTAPTWRVGAGGFNGPAGVVGLPSGIIRLISATARAAFTEEERGTLVIDAGDGVLSQVLRRDPETIRLLNDGRIRDLSISRSAQAGFAPLREAQDPADTALRWHWLFRGLGVETPHLDAALATGVRSFGDLGDYLDSDPAMASTGHAVRGLLEAEGGQVSRWLSGDTDVVSHLSAGGHILVDCPQLSPAHLFGLRGMLGLAMDCGARVISLGVNWPSWDEKPLQLLDAVVDQRPLSTTVMTTCDPSLAESLAQHYAEPALAEVLRTLPEDQAAVCEGGHWWTLPIP